MTLNQWSQKCSLLQIIEPMTTKCYRKCSPLQIIEPLTEKTWLNTFLALICRILRILLNLIKSGRYKSIFSINIDKNRLISILIKWLLSKIDKKSIAKAGVIIDFDWLFKLSSISINFYQFLSIFIEGICTSFLLTSASLHCRFEEPVEPSLKHVVLNWAALDIQSFT